MLRVFIRICPKILDTFEHTYYREFFNRWRTLNEQALECRGYSGELRMISCAVYFQEVARKIARYGVENIVAPLCDVSLQNQGKTRTGLNENFHRLRLLDHETTDLCYFQL